MNRKSNPVYVDRQKRFSQKHGWILSQGYEESGTGVRNGVWNYFDNESNLLVESVTYVENVRHGKALTYLATKKVLYECENQVNRVWVEETYKDDQLTNQINFNSNGIESRGSYVPLIELAHGDLFVYLYCDPIFLCEFLRIFKINPLHQRGMHVSSSNEVSIKGDMRVSLKDGSWEYFDERGKLKTRVFYHNGRRLPKEKFEEEKNKNENMFKGPIKINDGYGKMEATLREGHFEGLQKTYRKNGDLAYKLFYKNGNPLYYLFAPHDSHVIEWRDKKDEPEIPF